MLDKINVDEIQASSRMYPAIIFDQERDAGDQILEVDGLAAHDEQGNVLFQNLVLSSTAAIKWRYYVTTTESLLRS